MSDEYKKCGCGVLFRSAAGDKVTQCVSCQREECEHCGKKMLPRGHDAKHLELCRVCEDRGRRPRRRKGGAKILQIKRRAG